MRLIHSLLTLLFFISPGLGIAADEKKPATPAEGVEDLPSTLGSEFVTTAASKKLVQISEKMKDSKRQGIAAEMQDIIRVTKLDAARSRLLKIAMEGALEQGISNIRGNIQKGLDDRMKSANARNVKKLLDGFDTNYGLSSPKSQGIWKGAQIQILTPAEKAKWEDVVKRRNEYRAAALAGMLETELEERVGASDDQLEKLRPLLVKAVTDYLPDVSSMFSSDDDRSIYSEYLPVLLLGVDEKAAKAIIPDADQWKKWEAAPGEYRSQWEWIKRNHDSRMSQQKKGL